MAKLRNRWTPLPLYPMTKLISDLFPKNAKRFVARSEIVSEKLCDDALHRLSPYLLRNTPVDIIDLWPGAGLWSSKINDLLQPRRHLLVEPNLKIFKPMLQPLADSRSCYKLLTTEYPTLEALQTILLKHLPEQGPSNSDRSGALTTNDTLLVVANIPPASSKKTHFTPARWMASFMEACMQNIGVHSYGSVRLLASLPTLDAQSVLPRSTQDRLRPALLTECTALHAFEVAACPDSGSWMLNRGWHLTEQSAARVAQRAAEKGIVTPEGREMPPYELAPEGADPGVLQCPYVPRPRNTANARYSEMLKELEELEALKPEHARIPPTKNKKFQRATILLNQENRHAFIRQEFSRHYAEIYRLTRSLSRAAADPQTDLAALRPILDQIEAIKSTVAQQLADNHHDVMKMAPDPVDDRRAVLGTGNFDDATLLYDRRPFEPLLIDPNELFPRGVERSLIYFEPDPNHPAIRQLGKLEPSQRGEALLLFEAITFTISTRGLLSVAELARIIFPSRPINDLVKAIPDLATFAAKTPKPDFDALPKTVVATPEDASEDRDPADCYQENLDYDLSDVRVRSLSTKTIMDICVEYQKSDQRLSLSQLNRALGGMLTTFRSGEYLITKK